jgi:hypothetical protein
LNERKAMRKHLNVEKTKIAKTQISITKNRPPDSIKTNKMYQKTSCIQK